MYIKMSSGFAIIVAFPTLILLCYLQLRQRTRINIDIYYATSQVSQNIYRYTIANLTALKDSKV